MKVFHLREYQHLIRDHIIDNTRCSIFAGMGMGKTSATLQALEDLSLVEYIYPVLICAPKRVAKNTWPEEISKWEFTKDLSISIVVGTAEERIEALRKKADIYTINYEVIPWLIEHLGDRWPFKTIVADEQTKLKGFRLRQGSSRARALASRAFLSHRFIGLTGTPASNGMIDLWGQIYFIDKGQRLGKSFNAFQQRWFQLGYDGFSLTPLQSTQSEIEGKIRDVCISIDPKDYFDIKKPITNNIYVDLPSSAMKKYKEMEKEMFTEIEGIGIEAFNAGVKTGKSLQLANGAIYIDDKKNWKEVHDVKLEALEEIVEEASGMPVLVAYNFISDKERLMRRFPKALDLSTDKGLASFRTGKFSIGIAHPASMGHGIDGLQNVTNIIAVFGHDWNLELYDQINGRIGGVRQIQSGHDRSVFIHHIIARDTIDELVMERRETKRSVQDILLAAMKRRKQ